MRRSMHPARRAGFTLIELLVTIGIIALLAAIILAGIGQVRTAEMARTTDETVVKLQQGIDQMWKAVRDQAQEDRRNKKIPPALITFCDNDEDRAEVLWVYMNLRREFPQTFAEAGGTVPSTGNFNGVVLQPRKTFASASAVATTTTLTANEQSAVLLYMILSESSSRGVKFSIDDVTQGAQKQVGGFPVIADAWGTPISFIRFTQTAELNQPPHVSSPAAINLFDSIDPNRKLWDWNPPVNPYAGSNKKRQVEFGLGNATIQQPLTFTYTYNPTTNPTGTPVWNRRPTVVAAGGDRVFATDPLNGDDHYGYRLMRQGNKGE